ncbi:hypothetical protein Leryth_002981 [Lithospermum erythrorhizon]|nr:hypothetical protein Leryth_002981 [Lithospermum erythrorhizon]
MNLVWILGMPEMMNILGLLSIIIYGPVLILVVSLHYFHDFLIYGPTGCCS